MTAGLHTTDNTIRVLHLDDERSSLSATQSYFQRFEDDIEVETTTDPETALARIRDDPGAYDCLLCDYEMPAMDGLAVLSAVRSNGTELPFILYTGRGSNAIESDALDAGVTAYVEKDDGIDHLESLANRIETVVDEA